MRAEVAALLRCPHCAEGLAAEGRVLRCAAGHAFDVARQGYVNLLTGSGSVHAADTAEMVDARQAFLEAGHYAPIVDAVASIAVTGAPAGAVVDLGAGTGIHLAAVLARDPARVGLALDLSKYAVRRAARAHPRIGAAVCDAWGPLPVRSAVAGVALSVFAPRSGGELARVLVPEGRLVVATPTPAHLAEVTEPLGLLRVDEDKEQRLAATLGRPFVRESREEVAFALTLPHADVARLAAMGPSAWHTDPATVTAAVAALPDPVTVTASVVVSAYRRRRTLAD